MHHAASPLATAVRGSGPDRAHGRTLGLHGRRDRKETPA